MPKVTLSPILTDINGKIGNFTARKIGNTHIIQSNSAPYSKQPRPRSEEQGETWRRYGNLYGQFTKLAPVAVAKLADQGHPLNLSAWNMCVKKYMQFPDGIPPPPPPSFKLLVDNSGNPAPITDSPARLNLSNVPELFEACNNDPAQLELYTDDRTTPAGFYVESWNPVSSSATLIISATAALMGNSIYYLEINPDRTTALSNRNAVYIFYEDFSDWATLSERWQGDLSGLTKSGSYAILRGSSNTVTTKQKFNNCIIDWYGYQTALGSSAFGLYNPSPYVYIVLSTIDYLNSSVKNGSSSGSCGWTTAPYGWRGAFKFTIKRNQSTVSDFLVNDVHTAVSPCPAAANDTPASFYMYSYYAYGQSPYCTGCDATAISYLKVRKYANPEPTASLIEIIINE